MKHLLLCFFSFTFLLQGQEKEEISVKKVLKLMGTRFEITVIAPNEEIGYINIDEAVSEIKRIEAMISSWDSGSETSRINENAGIQSVKVSSELFQLIQRSKNISQITDGAFDISYAAMDGIWKFDGSMEGFPSSQTIASAKSKVDYNKIILDGEAQTVFLPEPGMRIGFGAIGKGFAADKAKELLVAKGVRGGIVNASGDLTTWGTKVTGEKWMIGLTDPQDKQKVFSWLPVVESSVATSGNYEKFVQYQGEKYSHIIDPRTGYPSKGVNSVSIFAQSAELCDALATAVFIMGRDSGIHLINQLDGVEVVLVDYENAIHKSSGIILDTSKPVEK